MNERTVKKAQVALGFLIKKAEAKLKKLTTSEDYGNAATTQGYLSGLQQAQYILESLKQ